MIIKKPKKIDKCAVGCIITYKGKYLLLHRTKDDSWGSVSGLPKPGETLKNAIIRETIEEIGIDMAQTHFKTTHHKYKDETVAYHIYVTDLDQDPTNKIRLSREHDKFGFFTLNQALKLNLFEDEDYCLKLHSVRYKNNK